LELDGLFLNHFTSTTVIKNAAVILGWNRPATTNMPAHEGQSATDQAMPPIDMVPLSHFPTSDYSADAQHPTRAPSTRTGPRMFQQNIDRFQPLRISYQGVASQEAGQIEGENWTMFKAFLIGILIGVLLVAAGACFTSRRDGAGRGRGSTYAAEKKLAHVH